MPNRGGTHEQHSKAGQKGHKNDGDRRSHQQAQSDNQRQAGADRRDRNDQERGRSADAGRRQGRS